MAQFLVRIGDDPESANRRMRRHTPEKIAQRLEIVEKMLDTNAAKIQTLIPESSVTKLPSMGALLISIPQDAGMEDAQARIAKICPDVTGFLDDMDIHTLESDPSA